jgi:hypothetical protein
MVTIAIPTILGMSGILRQASGEKPRFARPSMTKPTMIEPIEPPTAGMAA